MLSASGGPANGRNHAPIRWVMQHCGHTQVVGEAILWPPCGRPATLGNYE
jgi:hypothetical protein